MNDAEFAHIDDPDVPAVRFLLSGEAGGILDAVVKAQGGSTKSWDISQVRYSPGRSIVVRYRVDATWPNGRSSRETIVAGAGEANPDDTLILGSDGLEIAVWTYPNDPHLPGLAIAADAGKALSLLSQLGVRARRARIRLRAYRPARRAVLEVVTPRERVFLKVVRPDRVDSLQAKHQALAAELPVPHSHGWNRDAGLVALQSMPGKTLRMVLESGRKGLPAAEDFVGLLDALPDATGFGTAVKGPEQRSAFHGRLICAVVPELCDRVESVRDAVEAETPDEEIVPVHGDFHSSQLLIRGSSIVGLIDVDTAGMGRRSNDLANLLAHMSTVGLATAARRHIDRYGASLIREFDKSVDPRALRLKVAAAVLGLATGPFRVNLPRWQAQTERRVALAERWVASATDI